MAKFDLTYRIGQYLDRHLVLPQLEFLNANKVSFLLDCFTFPCGSLLTDFYT
jgi:hypothetical protein